MLGENVPEKLPCRVETGFHCLLGHLEHTAHFLIRQLGEVPGQFLIFVLPRIVQTLHEGPNNTVVGGQISGNYRLVLYLIVMPAFLALFVWLFQIRLRVMKLLAAKEWD